MQFAQSLAYLLVGQGFWYAALSWRGPVLMVQVTTEEWAETFWVSFSTRAANENGQYKHPIFMFYHPDFYRLDY